MFMPQIQSLSFPRTASHRKSKRLLIFLTITAVGTCLFTTALRADFFFSTGSPDGKIATSSRLPDAGKIEIESADDFITTDFIKLNSATFTGLLIGGASLADIADVGVEFYHVFPLDSANPPSGHVPTRVNSPSDDAFESRSFGDGN